MRRLGATILALLFVLAGALTGSQPAAAAPVIGVADQQPSMFSHQLFGWANIRHARVRAASGWRLISGR